MNHASLSRRRLNLAEATERAAVIERPVVCGGQIYLVQPDVTTACSGSLSAIAALLHDETHPIEAPILDALRTFIRDGASPFFGRDVAAARDEVLRIRHLVETGQISAPARPSPERRRVRTALPARRSREGDRHGPRVLKAKASMHKAWERW